MTARLLLIPEKRAVIDLAYCGLASFFGQDLNAGDDVLIALCPIARCNPSPDRYDSIPHGFRFHHEPDLFTLSARLVRENERVSVDPRDGAAMHAYSRLPGGRRRCLLSEQRHHRRHCQESKRLPCVHRSLPFDGIKRCGN